MKYFAVIDKKQIGPCSIEELVEAGLRPDNYVWCKGMDDWEPAKDVADICSDTAGSTAAAGTSRHRRDAPHEIQRILERGSAPGGRDTAR